MNKNEPLVSICCITYNHVKYIRDAIEGFLMQKTSFPIEIIIHDDASTDNTAQIIKEFADQNPVLFVTILQTENQWSKGGGSIFARFVFPRARGKYIALCEGDDYWTDPLKLQKQVEFLEANPDYVACFTNAKIKDELKNTERFFIQGLQEGRIPTKHVVLSGGGLYPTASLVYKQESIDFNIFQKISELAGDDLLIMSLAMVGDIYFINENTCNYRIHSGGVFSSIRDNTNRIIDLKKKTIIGYLKLQELTNSTDLKKTIKRKISVTSLFILKNDKKINKLKYFRYLHVKDLIRYILRLN